MRVLGRLLPESRRCYLSLLLAGALVLPGVILAHPGGEQPAWVVDSLFVFCAAYLLLYVALTVLAFGLVPKEQVRRWAAATTPGTWVDHVVRGTRPGPGQAAALSLVALVAVLGWQSVDPREGWLDPAGRAVVSVVVIAASWCAVLLTYSLAYLCQDQRSGGRDMDFPGAEAPGWSDYLYMAVAVSSTFGPTDVTVTSSAMRRTVLVHAVLAFVFNTVIIVTAISLMLG